MRFSNDGDPASFLDNSALKTTHPDPQNCAPSFWHDFHNKEQAGGRIAGVNVQGGVVKLSDIWINADKASTPNVAPKMDNTTKSNWTTEPWAQVNPDNSISITE